MEGFIFLYAESSHLKSLVLLLLAHNLSCWTRVPVEILSLSAFAVPFLQVTKAALAAAAVVLAAAMGSRRL